VNRKLIKAIAQALITVLALYLVLSKTDVPKLLDIIRHADLRYLLLSVLFFNLSKIINAIRLNRFFKAAGLQLSTWYNLKLYYLGMFYNLFLPGGVGGDGYKIYVLRKNHNVTVLNIFHAVFWDRVCGIFALVLLSIIMLIPSSFGTLYRTMVPYAWLIVALIYPLSWLLTRIFYRNYLEIFFQTALDSMGVQITQLISAWLILLAIGVHAHQFDYLAIFLVSTVATILPITIGGAGAREVTFYYALGYLGLETNAGVALSLIFFAIAALSSLAGVLSRIKHEKSSDRPLPQENSRN
jgi:uncharacterized membrane protein YbhN (UPF0104 family)